ncbi:MAG TPA: gamma-glutamyltransferase [Gemmatimonadaceae bacterium]|nr:gamma-glutamyltransferase [Gemmatimonadaceae bacterium]
MRHAAPVVALAIPFSLLAACTAVRPAPTLAPDLGRRLIADRGMVASATPWASDAGLAMLRQGGNAVDAAVATAFAVGVTEPMMSGIGAGGGMLIWLQQEQRAEYVDFYAAAGSDPDTALTHYHGPTDIPRAAGIPGAVAGLLDAQARYGKLSRSAVMAPAIRLASEGFPVHSLLHRVITADSAKLSRSPDARRIFLPGGHPLSVGQLLVQPELAATLGEIAAGGDSAFYRGDIADSIVQVLSAGGNPITSADFAAYAPRWRRPLCIAYHGRAVLSAPPPQSGVQVLETLSLLSRYDLPALGLPSRSPKALEVLAGAMRVADADRSSFIGDPDYVSVPANGLISSRFANDRASVISASPLPDTLAPGNPWPADSAAPAAACGSLDPFGPSVRPPRVARTASSANGDGYAETTHMSVVDADGDAVALTYTNGLYFGSGTWVRGMFLNSAMLNFSRADSGPNTRGAHRIPASTIAPTIVLDNGRVEMVVGSPGSAAIPPAVVETIVYALDYGLDPLQALRMPRMIPYTTSRLELEDGFTPAVLETARRLGYRIQTTPPTDLTFGGVHVIARVDGHWIGAADPRRDGEVRGY